MNISQEYNQEFAMVEAMKSGYVSSPNNIYGVPGVEYYAGGPGLPELADGLVFIDGGLEHSDHAQDAWPIVRYAHVYGQGLTLSPIARYRTWADFLLYCTSQRTTSQPGMPAGMFGD